MHQGNHFLTNSPQSVAKSVQQKLQVLSSWEEEKNISIWKDRGLLFDRLLIGIFMKTWNEELCRRRSRGGSSLFGGDFYQALPPSFFLWKSEEFSSKSIDWDGEPEYPIKVIVYYYILLDQSPQDHGGKWNHRAHFFLSVFTFTFQLVRTSHRTSCYISYPYLLYGKGG